MGTGVVEASQVVGAAHGDGAGEDVWEAAHHGDGIKRADGRAGGPDGDVLGVAVRSDRRHDLVSHVAMKLVLDPHLMARAAFAGDQRPAGDAVAGVELDRAGVDKGCKGAY